jgi:UDP-glucose 4-epimerase
MKTIVVTGGSGFIGGYVAKELRRIGNRVIVTSRKKLNGFVQIGDDDHYPEADIVMHFAEEPDRAKVNQNGDLYINSSAKSISKLANKFGKSLFYISSGIVYGDQGHSPFTTKSDTFAIDNYSRLKLNNEKIGLEKGATILRLANVYGYGMSENNVMSEIIKQITSNGSVKIRNEFPVRDFIFVEDVARICSMIIKFSIGGIFNIGSGKGVTIRELAEKLLYISGQQNRKVTSINKKKNFSYNVIDPSDTKNILSDFPRMNLSENLSKMLNLINKKEK